MVCQTTQPSTITSKITCGSSLVTTLDILGGLVDGRRPRPTFLLSLGCGPVVFKYRPQLLQGVQIAKNYADLAASVQFERPQALTPHKGVRSVAHSRPCMIR